MPSVWEEKGRGVVLHQPVCSVFNCAISSGREGPGSCFTPTGLPSIKLCRQFGLENGRGVPLHQPVCSIHISISPCSARTSEWVSSCAGTWAGYGRYGVSANHQLRRDNNSQAGHGGRGRRTSVMFPYTSKSRGSEFAKFCK